MLPPDAAALPPALESAKAALAGMVARRDLDALLAHVRPETTWCLAGHTGLDGFEEEWNTSGAQLDTFWTELESALSMPGQRIDEPVGAAYCAPYVFCAYASDIDVFDALVVTGSGVAIRDQPSLEGQVLTRVSHAVLTELRPPSSDDEPDSRWAPVRLASGLEGHVSRAYVRSPVDFRLSLVSGEGSNDWWIQYFIAGD